MRGARSNARRARAVPRAARYALVLMLSGRASAWHSLRQAFHVIRNNNLSWVTCARLFQLVQATFQPVPRLLRIALSAIVNTTAAAR
jgi:hypothetical protein